MWDSFSKFSSLDQLSSQLQESLQQTGIANQISQLAGNVLAIDEDASDYEDEYDINHVGGQRKQRTPRPVKPDPGVNHLGSGGSYGRPAGPKSEEMHTVELNEEQPVWHNEPSQEWHSDENDLQQGDDLFLLKRSLQDAVDERDALKGRSDGLQASIKHFAQAEAELRSSFEETVQKKTEEIEDLVKELQVEKRERRKLERSLELEQEKGASAAVVSDQSSVNGTASDCAVLTELQDKLAAEQALRESKEEELGSLTVLSSKLKAKLKQLKVAKDAAVADLEAALAVTPADAEAGSAVSDAGLHSKIEELLLRVAELEAAEQVNAAENTARVNEHATEVQRLQALLDTNAQQLHDWSQQAEQRDLENQNQQQKQNLESNSLEEMLQAELIAKTAELEELTEQQKQHSAANEIAKAVHIELVAKTAELEDLTQKLQTAMDALNTAEQRDEESRASALAEANRHEAVVADLSAQLQELQDVRERATAELVAEHRAVVDSMQQESSHVQQELEATKMSALGDQESVEQLASNVKQLQEIMDSQKAEYEAQISGLDQELLGLRTSSALASTRETEQISMINMLEEQVALAEEQAARTSASLERVLKTVTNLKGCSSTFWECDIAARHASSRSIAASEALMQVQTLPAAEHDGVINTQSSALHAMASQAVAVDAAEQRCKDVLSEAVACLEGQLAVVETECLATASTETQSVESCLRLAAERLGESVAALQLKLHDLQSKLQAEVDSGVDLQRAAAEKSELLEASQRCVEQLTVDLETAEASAAESAKELELAWGSIEALSVDLQTEKAYADDLTAELEAAKASTSEMVKELDTARASVEKLTRELDMAETSKAEELEAAKATTAKLTEELEIRNNSAAGLTAELEARDSSMLLLRSGAEDKDALIANLTAQQSEVAAMSNERDAMQVEMAGHVDRMQGMTHKMEGMQQESSKALESVTRDLEATVAALAEKKQELSECSQSLQEATHRITQQEADLLQTAEMLSDLRESRERLVDEAGSLRSELAAANTELKVCQETVAARESELSVIRDGTTAEVALASTSVKEAGQKRLAAENRAQELEKQLADTSERCKAAEDSTALVETAMAATRGTIAELQETVKQRQSEIESLHADSKRKLQAAAQEGKRAVTLAVTEAQNEMREALQEEMRQKAEARGAKLKEQLQLQNVELDDLQSEVARLQGDLAEAVKAQHEAETANHLASADAAEVVAEEVRALDLQLESAQERIVELETELRGVTEAGSERTRKFSLLQGMFKTEKEALQQQLEAAKHEVNLARQAIEEHHNTAADATARADQSVQEVAELRAQNERAVVLRDQLQAEVREGQEAHNTLQEKLLMTESSLAMAEGQVRAVQQALSQEDIERRVQALMQSRNDSAERSLALATQRVTALEDSLEAALSRAEAAEKAKIELTMALAVASAENTQVTDGFLPGHASASTLVTQIEEAELACHNANRRAMNAEMSLEETEAKLLVAEDAVRSLSWQVKMSSDGPTPGAQSSNMIAADSWLGSMLGCGPLKRS